jgi:hypothetical protein
LNLLILKILMQTKSLSLSFFNKDFRRSLIMPVMAACFCQRRFVGGGEFQFLEGTEGPGPLPILNNNNHSSRPALMKTTSNSRVNHHCQQQQGMDGFMRDEERRRRLLLFSFFF